MIPHSTEADAAATTRDEARARIVAASGEPALG
jgi:hypothetical protein